MVGRGLKIEVVEGADDVAGSCPSRSQKCVATLGADTEIREMDAEAVEHLGVEAGSKALWQEMKAKVTATPKEWLAAFCEGCGWEGACTETKDGLGRHMRNQHLEGKA